MAALNLFLLGGFELRSSAGAPVTVAAKKAKALLAYLAVSAGRAHPRDKLAGLLWEERVLIVNYFLTWMTIIF